METAEFAGGISMNDCTIAGPALFDHSEFHHRADFRKCEFEDDLGIRGAKFDREFLFLSCSVSGSFNAELSSYQADATFSESNLHGPVNMDQAVFERNLEFDVVMFSDVVDLETVEVNGRLTVESSGFPAGCFFAPKGYVVGDDNEITARS